LSAAICRRGARRAETPRESRIVVASPELVELVRQLRADFDRLDWSRTTEVRFLLEYLRGGDRWISTAIVLHPSVGPQVQLELRPTDDLRALAASMRDLATRRSA
jgi:hypothetical protein